MGDTTNQVAVKIEPLYDDDKINATFLDVGFAEYAADAFTTALECAKFMRSQYEKERSIQAAEIERLRAALAAAKSEILFMPPYANFSYAAQVDMRRRCYEAIDKVEKKL